MFILVRFKYLVDKVELSVVTDRNLDFPPPSLDFERDLPLDLDLALPQIGGDLALALPSGVLSSGSGLESLRRSSTVGASAP